MFTASSPLQHQVFTASPPQSTYFSNPLNQYLPQTPSPLRTSRNANLMPPPPTPANKSSPFDYPAFSNISPTDENASPLATLSIFTPSTSTSASTSKSSPFDQPSTTKSSRFEQRARSSSPQAVLNSSTAAARNRRKSAFLDRLRTRREEDRFAEKDDQVMRMDFIRERREWEARQRWAETECEPELIDEVQSDGAVEQLKEQSSWEQNYVEGLSPTEDKEIEELLSYMPDESGEGNGDFIGEDEDEIYDRLFAEMQVDDHPMSQGKADATDSRREVASVGQIQEDAAQVEDEAMDIS